MEKLLQKNRDNFLPPDTKHLKVKFTLEGTAIGANVTFCLRSLLKSIPKQLFLQILSESGPLNSKILVKYSFQVGVFQPAR